MKTTEKELIFNPVSSKIFDICFSIEIIIKIDAKRNIKFYADPFENRKLKKWEIRVSEDWKDNSKDIFNSLSKAKQKELIKFALQTAQDKIDQSGIFKLIET